MLDMPKARDDLREAEDSCDQSAKSADKPVATLNAAKEVIAKSLGACVITDYVSLRAQPSNGQLAAASCCR